MRPISWYVAIVSCVSLLHIRNNYLPLLWSAYGRLSLLRNWILYLMALIVLSIIYFSVMGYIIKSLLPVSQPCDPCQHNSEAFTRVWSCSSEISLVKLHMVLNLNVDILLFSHHNLQNWLGPTKQTNYGIVVIMMWVTMVSTSLGADT
jgi:hypothetical protein